MSGILSFFTLNLGLKDLAEIALVAFLVYRVLLIYKGTRAFHVFIGFIVLVTIYALAQAADLGLITYLLSQVFTYGAFALIVIFQQELRSGLAHLGRTRLWRLFGRREEQEVVSEITAAADRLSRARIGGIIAVEREVDLTNFVDEGTPLNATVTADLLTTIFTPYSALHDGAVLIKRDRISHAGSVVLRLSESPSLERTLGTRHRAAIGLSEETDAMVIVISEETGQVSLAHRGRLSRGLSAAELQERLAGTGEEEAGPSIGSPTQSTVFDAIPAQE